MLDARMPSTLCVFILLNIPWVLSTPYACATGGSFSGSSLDSTECIDTGNLNGGWVVVPTLQLPIPNFAMSPISFGSVACLAAGSAGGGQAVICTNGSGWVPSSTLTTSRIGANTFYSGGWVAVAFGGPNSWETASTNYSSSSSSTPSSIISDWTFQYSTGQKIAYTTSHWLNGSACTMGGLVQNILALSWSSCLKPDGTWEKRAEAYGYQSSLTIPRYQHTRAVFDDLECLVGGIGNTGGLYDPLYIVECINASTPPPAYFDEMGDPYPLDIYGAANLSTPELSCVLGGTVESTSNDTELMFCGFINSSTINWIPAPSLHQQRTFHATFFLDQMTIPTSSPTLAPSQAPTHSPTSAPTSPPTSAPTPPPTTSPTNAPTSPPTLSPTNGPTASPIASPTSSPTSPTTLAPTSAPTSPTTSPTASPSTSPSSPPTSSPTHSSTPTSSPSKLATSISPSHTPSVTLSAAPSSASPLVGTLIIVLLACLSR